MCSKPAPARRSAGWEHEAPRRAERDAHSASVGLQPSRRPPAAVSVLSPAGSDNRAAFLCGRTFPSARQSRPSSAPGTHAALTHPRRSPRSYLTDFLCFQRHASQAGPGTGRARRPDTTGRPRSSAPPAAAPGPRSRPPPPPQRPAGRTRPAAPGPAPPAAPASSSAAPEPISRLLASPSAPLRLVRRGAIR